METCDVAIVSGGPAGSACAWRLRQTGVDVVVIDKAAFPRRHRMDYAEVLDDLQIDGHIGPPRAIIDRFLEEIHSMVDAIRQIQPCA